METTKYIYFLVLMFIAVNKTYTQTDQAIYNAYISGNMSEWKKTMDGFKANNNIEKLQLLNYYYGYIAYCIGKKEKAEAEKYLRRGEKIIEELEKQRFQLSMIYAYKSAFLGFNIGISHYKAPLLGKESLSYVKASLKLDANNYFAHLQYGNILFFKPAMFGGSKPEALKQYLKALELYQKNSSMNKNNWNYLNIYIAIINAYDALHLYDMAKYYCEKVLAIEPHFDWVKNDIYPKILKRLQNG